ncbi:MAG: DUF3048 domain-containing protein [Jiangellaceae bacterium]
MLPLTGTPATDGVPDRPVLVVKVDNTQHGRPQVGLSQADLVVEELVEGGLTRLAVMFHSALPEVVVPVRSIRTTDVGIVAPTGGALVASGGAGRVLRIVDQAGITVVAEGDPGLSREASRSAPYNVVLDPAAALNGLTGQAPPAVPYLAWAPSGATPPAGTVASSVTVMFSAAHSTRWEWADGVWRRLDELAAEGDEFRPANVLVLRVTTRDAGYQDPAGNPVPETVLEGSGAATLLTGGRAVESRWSKASPAQPFELSDASGASLAVPPGRTWIELVPEAGSVDTG